MKIISLNLKNGSDEYINSSLEYVAMIFCPQIYPPPPTTYTATQDAQRHLASIDTRKDERGEKTRSIAKEQN